MKGFPTNFKIAKRMHNITRISPQYDPNITPILPQYYPDVAPTEYDSSWAEGLGGSSTGFRVSGFRGLGFRGLGFRVWELVFVWRGFRA